MNQEEKKLYENEYYHNNPKRLQYLKDWQKEKRKKDINFLINDRARCIMYQSLKKDAITEKTFSKYFDYTLGELKRHLENKFDENMNWGNYGTYWSIEHIKPRSSFKIKEIKDFEYNLCWCLDNIKPMNKIENMVKGKKYPYLVEKN